MWGFFMIIRSIQGSILYKSDKISFKAALEQAVKRGVDLSHGDFRGQKLYRAHLDGIIAPGACLWGSDCRGADMAGADLRDADLRNINFKDACLAESNLEGANLSGSFFNNTIFRGTNMGSIIFSCPSLFSCDLEEAFNFHHAIYCHKGECDIVLDHAPITVRGLRRGRIIIMGDYFLWQGDLFKNTAANDDLTQEFRMLKTTIDRFL